MNRRTLLTATALLPIAGCATIESTLGMTPAQWATDLSLAAGWMPSIVAALKALGVKQATLDQITKWAATLNEKCKSVSLSKNWLAIFLYGISIPLAYVSLSISTVIFILIPILYFLPSHYLSEAS